MHLHISYVIVNVLFFFFFAVVEHAYHLANAAQKQTLLQELYSLELQLFKDMVSVKESRFRYLANLVILYFSLAGPPMELCNIAG